MGLIERLFGKRLAQVQPAALGKGLAEIASGAARPDLLEMLINDLPQRTLGDAFLAVAPLSLFAWIRASNNEPLQLGSPAARQEIYDNFASVLVVHYVRLFGSERDPDAIVADIKRIAQRLVEVWNSSQDKPPAPHWYVGKEVWSILEANNENPDPARIMLLSELLTTQTKTLLEFARRVQIVPAGSHGV